jgi:hypothetical protein
MVTEKQQHLKERKHIIQFIITRIKQINSYDLMRMARSLGYGY